MIIYKCDLCEAEVDEIDVYKVTINHMSATFRYSDNFPATRLDYEVCPKCRDKIFKFIECGGEEQ